MSTGAFSKSFSRDLSTEALEIFPVATGFSFPDLSDYG